MTKTLLTAFLLLLIHSTSVAGKVPSGYMEVSELEEAKAKAVKAGKLVAIVVKGEDDACPRCAAALDNGTKAIKSDAILVFMRVGEAREGKGLPESVAKETADAVSGAAVTFYVFDSALESLVAEAGRDELESNKKAIRAFKDKVSEARKTITGK